MDKKETQTNLDTIRELLTEMYSDCASVCVELNSEGMSVTTKNVNAVCGHATRRIDGTWVQKFDKLA